MMALLILMGMAVIGTWRCLKCERISMSISSGSSRILASFLFDNAGVDSVVALSHGEAVFAVSAEEYLARLFDFSGGIFST